MFGLFKTKRHAAKLLPESAWQGTMGQALRDAGFSPDDPANKVEFDSPVEARLAQARVAMEIRLRERNREIARQYPDASLAAMFILTDGVWNGPHGKTLIERVGLTPYDDFNVRFLAADEMSARKLGIDRVYSGEIPQFVEVANRLLGEIIAEASNAGDFGRFVGRDTYGLANWLWEEHISPGLKG